MPCCALVLGLEGTRELHFFLVGERKKHRQQALTYTCGSPVGGCARLPGQMGFSGMVLP